MSLNIIQSTGDSKPRENRKSDAAPAVTYDLVCVGFGVTALPLAAALAEQNAEANILFIEREPHFRWLPANILPDKAVGTSFLRDLVTTQNPRSSYTFVNFLHATNQLIRFTNNSRLAPSRRLMGLYFEWAAERIQHLGWVRYGQEAVRVQPVKSKGQDKIAKWSVLMQNTKTKAQSSVVAKRVVLASGAQAHIPQALSGAPLLLHSSQTDRLVDSIGTAKQPLSIAVIGSDQEAADIFEHLHTTRQGKHMATMFYPDSALRPEDHVPNVQDMLERPEAEPSHLPPEVRERLQHKQSQPQVDLKTLENLYEAQYTQKIHEPDSNKWRFQMRPHSEVVGIEREHERVRLVVKNPRSGEVTTTTEVFDIVIAATGYSFSINRRLVDIPATLLNGDGMAVDREYQIGFRRGALAAGMGMWILGSLEDRKARADNFGWMAERAQRVSRSILKEMQRDDGSDEQHAERAMF